SRSPTSTATPFFNIAVRRTGQLGSSTPSNYTGLTTTTAALSSSRESPETPQTERAKETPEKYFLEVLKAGNITPEVSSNP
ncbi:unnamed protein product, partial [Amoebophrya sp. A25]